MADVKQFALDIDAENASRQMQQSTQLGKGITAEQFAQQFEQLTREAGTAELNPIAAEKIQRDNEYQRQMETIPQPSIAPELPVSTPELDRLDQLQKELDATRQEAAKFKRLYGQKTGDVGVLRRELGELQQRVNTITPQVNVRQITGKEADEPLTAGDVVNLLMSQSQAFGNGMRQMRDELLQQGYGQSSQDGLPLDLEAELVESHPWLSDLPRPNRLRAMHDILASSGVHVAPPNAQTQGAPSPSALPEAARRPVRQAAYIEPSNRGSAAERDAIAPERAALNDKVAKLQEMLRGPYKPGVSDKAAELLAQLGAGPIDETQGGVFSNWRGR